MFNIHRQVRTLFLIDLDMIPDKIYLHPDDRHWWHEGNKTDDRFVEYIRKDTVLDILENSKHLADAAYKIDEL